MLAMAFVVGVGISDGTVNWSATNGAFTIMLDPGHGGSDPGALGPSAPHEGELALRCANALVARFNELGCNYKMTRYGDETVSLSSRNQQKIAYDPWIFCSIHLNSGNAAAHGTETFYHHTTGNSSKLANYVQNSIVRELGTYSRRCMTDNAYYGYALAVLNDSYASIPSILTESMFVCNPNEWGRIKDQNSEGFRSWVNGHLYGFYDYFYNVHGASYGGNTIHNPREAQKSIEVDDISFTCARGERPWRDVTVTGTKLSEGITIWCDNNDIVELGTTWLDASGGTVRVTFKDTDSYGAHETWIHFKSGDVQKDVKVTCQVEIKPLGDMNEGYVLSTNRGNHESKGYDATNIRNFAYNDGKLYCVYNHNRIIVLNAQTGDYLGDLKLGGIVGGGVLDLCDVQTYQGRIFACNLAGTNNNLRIYCWEKDTENPTLVLETSDLQGCTRLGDAMSIAGTYPSDCWYGFLYDTGTESRIVEYHQENSSWSSKYTLACKGDGSYLKVGANPRVYIWGGGNYWVDGNFISPCYLAGAGNGKANCAAANDTGGQTQGASHHEFYFRGQKYAAGLVFRGSANYTGGKMRLLRDLPGNFTNNDLIQELPADGLGNTPNTNGTGEVIINTDGDKFVEAWVMSTRQGIAYLRYGEVPSLNPEKVNQPTIGFSERDSKVSAVAGQSVVKTLHVNGTNLKGGISITMAGPGAERFTVEPTWLDGPGEVRITYRPTDWSYDWIWLGANSEGAETAWTDVHGSSSKSPVIEVTGDANFDTNVNEATAKQFVVRGENLTGIIDAAIEGDNSDQFEFSHTFGLQPGTTVYFDNNRAGWDKVYVWLWDMDNPTLNVMGCEWPGVELTTQTDGLYSYTFTPADTSRRYGIKFANAANHTQTDDAQVINGAVYSAAGKVADRWPHSLPAIVRYQGTLDVTYRPNAPGAHTAILHAGVSSGENSEIRLYGFANEISGVGHIYGDQEHAILLIDRVLTIRSGKVGTIDVFALTGQHMHHTPRSAVADLKSLAPGLYIVVITDETGGQMLRQKIELK